MLSPELGNVPAQPQYGEVQEIEAQEAGAPLPQATEPPTPSLTPASVEQAAPAGPRGTNIVDVLPSLEAAPANSGQRPARPEQQLAYLIMGTPGMSGLTRSFAAQILGRFREKAYLPQQNLSASDLGDYQTNQVQEQMTAATVPEE